MSRSLFAATPASDGGDDEAMLNEHTDKGAKATCKRRRAVPTIPPDTEESSAVKTAPFKIVEHKGMLRSKNVQ